MSPAQTSLSLLLALFLFIPASAAFGLEIQPFRTANRSPVIQVYGLPAETSSALLKSGQWQAGLSQDIASIYSVNSNATEQILLDGELYRWTLAARYGLTDRVELGVELPFVLQGGGFLDSFIIDWHTFFGLPQGGRDTAPKNRLRYHYVKNDVQKLDMTHASGGIGDVSLLAAYRLYDQQTATDHDTIALRSQLKLPTGNSSNLLGSGSIDFSLLLSGAMNRRTEWGTLGVYGAVGGLVTSDGDILSDQRQNLIAFGNAGIGYAPTDWINFKVQADLTTPFYKNSSLAELGKGTSLMTFGGTLKLPGNYLLDIGVAEDIAVATAPDVVFHLGLSKRF